jgi:hypothetical protein
MNYGKKVKTVMVNDSTKISGMKNYLSPQIMKPVLIIFLSNLMKM